LGTSGKYTDRPTITYAPITGEKFNQSFMTPIPPKALLFLVETGWPVEMVFPIVVEAINGLRSRIAAGKHARQGDPGFYRFISLFQQLQRSGNTSMRIVKGKDEKETTVMFLYRDNLAPDTKAAMEELEKLLGLSPGTRELTVSYGILPETDRELAIQTRSMMQIMVSMAETVDVPERHVEEGRTIPTLVPPDSEESRVGREFKVWATADKPAHAFVAIKYRDHWFWIDDRDFYSKRAFTFLMILFSLTESGGKGGLPLVTIPAG
jgi:hypothetical protein